MPRTQCCARSYGGTLAAAVIVVVVALVVGLTPRPVAASGYGGTSPLRRVFQQALAREGYPGSLAQVNRRPGGPSDVALGSADLRTGEPPRADMHFRIASITKTFVATTVLQLVAEHRLRLGDPIARWLPGLIGGNGNNGARIAIRMLLNHTSGLYDYSDDEALGEAYDADPSLYLTPRQLVKVAVRHRRVLPLVPFT